MAKIPTRLYFRAALVAFTTLASLIIFLLIPAHPPGLKGLPTPSLSESMTVKKPLPRPQIPPFPKQRPILPKRSGVTKKDNMSAMVPRDLGPHVRKIKFAISGILAKTEKRPFANTIFRVNVENLYDLVMRDPFFPDPDSAYGKRVLTDRRDRFQGDFTVRVRKDKTHNNYLLIIFSLDSKVFRIISLPEDLCGKKLQLGWIVLRESPVLLSGRIVKKDGSPLSNTNFCVDIPPFFFTASPHFYSLKTGRDGRFLIRGQVINDFPIGVHIRSNSGYYLDHVISPSREPRENISLVAYPPPGIRGKLFLDPNIPPEALKFRIYYHRTLAGEEDHSAPIR